jgi:hypothetical protein
LEALKALRSVISGQFKPWRENWLIEGTPGVAFLKREVEELPFVRTYVLATALRVGPHHALSFDHTTRVWSVAEAVHAAKTSNPLFKAEVFWWGDFVRGLYRATNTAAEEQCGRLLATT